MRLAKGEITPEQYQASLKMLQGADLIHILTRGFLEFASAAVAFE
jgi:hypothetical protein